MLADWHRETLRAAEHHPGDLRRRARRNVIPQAPPMADGVQRSKASVLSLRAAACRQRNSFWWTGQGLCRPLLMGNLAIERSDPDYPGPGGSE